MIPKKCSIIAFCACSGWTRSWIGHAKYGIKGKALKTEVPVKDPDRGNHEVTLPKDEIEVRDKYDNSVRGEQVAKPRAKVETIRLWNV